MKPRDVLPAVLFAIVGQVELLLTSGVSVWVHLPLLGLIGLAWRRFHPLATLLGLAGMVVAISPGTPTDLATPNLAVVFAAFSLGFHGLRAAMVTGWIAASLAMTVAGALQPASEYSFLDDLVWYAVAVIGMPVAAGRLLSTRSLLSSALRDRTRRLTADREVVPLMAAVEERAHLSARLHDVVADRVAEIALQAEGATSVAEAEPERAREALASIEVTARSALDDIRDVIGWLRVSDSA